MWQSVHWLLPCWLYFTIISCPSVHFCWAHLSSQHCFYMCKNTELWIGVCYIGYRLLNASVFCLCPSDALSCVREILWFLLPNVACFCPSCFTFSMILTLLWSTRIVLLVWPCSFLLSWTRSPAPLLHHCACELLYRKDYTACLQTVGVWSLSPEQEGDEKEDAVHFFCSL